MVIKQKYCFLKNTSGSETIASQPMSESALSNRTVPTASPVSEETKEDQLYCSEELSIPILHIGKRKETKETSKGDKKNQYEKDSKKKRYEKDSKENEDDDC